MKGLHIEAGICICYLCFLIFVKISVYFISLCSLSAYTVKRLYICATLVFMKHLKAEIKDSSLIPNMIKRFSVWLACWKRLLKRLSDACQLKQNICELYVMFITLLFSKLVTLLLLVSQSFSYPMTSAKQSFQGSGRKIPIENKSTRGTCIWNYRWEWGITNSFV